jgi:hypothetical protein
MRLLAPKYSSGSTCRAKPATLSPGLLAVLICSILLQGFVAAGHLHTVATGSTTPVVKMTRCAVADLASLQNPCAPAKDHSTCLLCQAVSLGGAILVDSHSGLVELQGLPTVLGRRAGQLPHTFIMEFGSRQRGPPTL